MSTQAFRPTANAAWVIASEEPLEVALARVPEGPPMVLESTAAAIWEALVTTATGEEITEHLRAAGLDPPVDATEQVLRFVEELRALGLVESVVPEGHATTTRSP